MFKLLLSSAFSFIWFPLTMHGAEPLKMCFLSGSAEYESDTSLESFKKHIEKDFPVRVTLLKARGFNELSGLEALDDCDVAVFFTRRLTIDGEALDRIKKYCDAGKPIVALRTASHGFQNWLEFDKLILGGNYQGHFGEGPALTAQATPEGMKHPALEGVPATIESKYSLYRTAPLAEDATVLMTGETAESGGAQPVTWVREHRGGRIFYTSLGGPEDFNQPDFQRLLVNALFWSAKREVAAD